MAPPVLRRRSRDREAVEHLQNFLNARAEALGIEPIAVDGDFGSRTEAAVRAYQASQGLQADGVVGRNTWDKIAAGGPPPAPTQPAPTPVPRRNPQRVPVSDEVTIQEDDPDGKAAISVQQTGGLAALGRRVPTTSHQPGRPLYPGFQRARSPAADDMQELEEFDQPLNPRRVTTESYDRPRVTPHVGELNSRPNSYSGFTPKRRPTEADFAPMVEGVDDVRRMHPHLNLDEESGVTSYGPMSTEKFGQGFPEGLPTGPRDPYQMLTGNFPKGEEIHGLIRSPVAGRTDQLPIRVDQDSFIVPADIVSGLGQGNTDAGAELLDELTNPPTAGPPPAAAAPGSFQDRATSLIDETQRTIDAGRADLARRQAENAARRQRLGMARGGRPKVSIVAAGGEYVVAPSRVAAWGHGDIELGQKLLADMVRSVRRQTIQQMSTLPGPKK